MATLLMGQTTFAQTLYWDANGSTAGAGVNANGDWSTNPSFGLFWDSAADGTGTIVPWVSGDLAVFCAGNDTTNAIVTVDGTETAGGITFKNGVVTLFSGTLTLTGGATIDVNAAPVKATITSVISGSNGLTKRSSGELMLTGANPFTGNLTNIAGTITLNNDQAGGQGSIVLSPVSTVTLHSSQSLTTLTNDISLSGNSSPINVAADAGNSLDLNGSISGSHSWNVTGLGTVVLGGSTFNTFAGALVVSNGVLVAAKDQALGGSVNATVVESGATLAFQGGFIYTPAQGTKTINLLGAGFSGGAALNNTGGANKFDGDVVLMANSSVGSDAGSLDINGPLTGGFNLTKLGVGEVDLTGIGNIYGATLVSQGTLGVFGSSVAGSGLVTVSAGASLVGDGSVPGGVNLSGTISPGDGPGTLNSGAETWNAGSSYSWRINDFNGTQGSDPGWSFLNITGALTISATPSHPLTIAITSLNPNSDDLGLAGNFDNTAEYTRTIVTASGGISGFDPTAVVVDPSGFENPPGNGAFIVQQSGNSIIVRFVQKPQIVTGPATQTLDECQDATFMVTASGTAPLLYQWSSNSVPVAGATDSSYTIHNLTTSDAASYSVTVSNVSTNTASASATLTVLAPNPIFNGCPSPVVVQTGPGRGTCDQIATWTQPTVSDFCQPVMVSSNHSSGDPFPVGMTVVTYTATDSRGRMNTCSFTVTVQDNTPPVASVHPITVHLDPTGNYALTPSDIAAISAGSTDNCSISNRMVTPNAFTCANVGSNPVTLVLTDNSGNTTTTNTTVSVVDNPPVVAFNSISVRLDATGIYTLTPADIAAIAAGTTDSCSLTNTNVVPSSLTFCDVGTKTITLTVMDNHGGQTSTNGTITVLAPISPASVVYVDASYPATCSAVAFPNSGTGPYFVGFNAFKTVQAAVNHVASGGTINVAAGTYNENVSASQPVTLLGANQGASGCGPRGLESIISGGTNGIAVDVTSDDVTLDGFELAGATGFRDIGHIGVTAQNNLVSAGAMTASAVGFDLEGIATTLAKTVTVRNNCITLASQLTGSPTAPQTAGLILLGVTGPQAPGIQNNSVSGAWFGYLLYSLNAAGPTIVEGGTVTGAMQGLAVFNAFAVPPAMPVPASSSFVVNDISMSGFTGNYPPLAAAGVNFHAGVYLFTGGSSTAAKLSGSILAVTVTGTGKISPDSSGLYFGDFSTATGTLQQVNVQDCTINANENRGIYARGSNAVVNISNCSLIGNGFDPYGIGGNDGFGIVNNSNATLTVSQCFITNPSTVAAPYHVYAVDVFASPGRITAITDCSLNNNGNASGKLVSVLSGGTVNASGNWWGTTSESTITNLQSGFVDFTPYLDSGTDTDGNSANGFQGDFSTLHVTTLGVQTGLSGRVQEGHDDATGATPTVIVSPGTYDESVVISQNRFSLKSLLNTVTDPMALRNPESIMTSINPNGTIQINANSVTIDGMEVNSGATGIGIAVETGTTGATIVYNSVNGGATGIAVSGTATLMHDLASSPANSVGVLVSGSGKALLENNSLTGDTEAGIKVTDTAIVDAGDCTGANVTHLGTGSGLGGSSAGSNDLSGYIFDSAPPWAIENLDSGTVVADDDNFGAVAGQNIGAVLLQGSPIRFTQSGGLLIRCPAPTTVECPFNIPTGASDYATFLSLGGTISASTATVSYMDSPHPPSDGSVTRTYTITDECGQTAMCTQTITVHDTMPPVIAGTVGPLSTNADSNCNAIVPDVRSAVQALSSDQCTSQASLVVTQNPLQGSTANGRGSHPITVTVTDAAGLFTQTTVALTVIDVTPPVLTGCPANMVVSGAGPTMVTYTAPTANDACDGSVAVVCTPPSGSTFPVGPTLVTCTATDGTGNHSSCSFYVDVCSPIELTTYVDANYTNLPNGTPVAWPNGVGITNHVLGCDAWATVQGGGYGSGVERHCHGCPRNIQRECGHHHTARANRG